MSVLLEINTDAYNDLGKDDFGSFGNNVAEVGKDNEVYEDQAAAITEVEDAAKIYGTAIATFNTNRGKDRTKNLENARKGLSAKLKELVLLLEAAAPSKPDPEAFLIGLGFTLKKVPGRRTNTVNPPVKQSATSGGRNQPRGKVNFVLKAEFPEEIKAIIGKRSDDGGVTWVEGIVATKLKFFLTGQPSGVDCIYRFKFLATNNRESIWSANIPVSVF